MRVVVNVRLDVLDFSHVINGLLGLTVGQCWARSDKDHDQKAEGAEEKEKNKSRGANEIKINAKITESLKPFSR